MNSFHALQAWYKIGLRYTVFLGVSLESLISSLILECALVGVTVSTNVSQPSGYIYLTQKYEQEPKYMKLKPKLVKKGQNKIPVNQYVYI